MYSASTTTRASEVDPDNGEDCRKQEGAEELDRLAADLVGKDRGDPIAGHGGGDHLCHIVDGRVAGIVVLSVAVGASLWHR